VGTKQDLGVLEKRNEPFSVGLLEKGDACIVSKDISSVN
jgi:hypothetical protein